MMIDPQVHLTDEELLALRDGLYLDKRLLEHVEHCDYCQAVLSEWRRFHEVLVRSDPQAMEPGAGHYFSLAMADDAEITRADLHEDLLSEASSPLDHRPEEEWRKADAPPAALLEAVQENLGQRPNRLHLGALTLYTSDAAEVHLEAAGAKALRSGEMAYPVGNALLCLGARQAGLVTLLVARLAGPWITEHADAYDITLVNPGGGLQMQPLLRHSRHAQGMAWFSVPDGESELLIHLEDTWQIPVRKVFSAKV